MFLCEISYKEIKIKAMENLSIAFKSFNILSTYVEFFGCSTNPVGEKSPTGFFICKKEKSRL